jgi:hypothetical protein
LRVAADVTQSTLWGPSNSGASGVLTALVHFDILAGMRLRKRIGL